MTLQSSYFHAGHVLYTCINGILLCIYLDCTIPVVRPSWRRGVTQTIKLMGPLPPCSLALPSPPSSLGQHVYCPLLVGKKMGRGLHLGENILSCKKELFTHFVCPLFPCTYFPLCPFPFVVRRTHPSGWKSLSPRSAWVSMKMKTKQKMRWVVPLFVCL